MFSSFLIGIGNIFPILAQFAHATPAVQAGPAPQAISTLFASGIYPEPEKCVGACASIHDPNIVYENNTYWRFTTSNNISIATAPFLQGPWTYRGSLLPNGSSIRLRDDQDIWVCRPVFLHHVFSFTNTPNRHPQYSATTQFGTAITPSLTSARTTPKSASQLPPPSNQAHGPTTA